eukprot:scaffold569997_cov20-Prasinocladus_malaysianus.AAC.1
MGCPHRAVVRRRSKSVSISLPDGMKGAACSRDESGIDFNSALPMACLSVRSCQGLIKYLFSIWPAVVSHPLSSTLV